MSRPWTEAWLESVGSRVSVVLDDLLVVEGVVTKVWPLALVMRVKGDDGRLHHTHPRYARPVWSGGQP